MARGIRASVTGLETAKRALKRQGWTQEYLAGRSACSRQTISQFFARKPIEKRIFQAICSELELEWGEIAEFDSEEPPEQPIGLEELVETVRSSLYDSIQEKCGSMRVLDMNQPIELGDIYTTVNILEQVTGTRSLELSELSQDPSSETSKRLFFGVQGKRISGLEAVERYTKLMILGHPGAGKTTFLKHLAIQCIEKAFKPELVPLFVTLRDFAGESQQSDLFNYLTRKVVTNSDPTAIEQLLRQGKGLVLLDGLDEVREQDSSRVIQHIQDFTNLFHKNLFVITCRIAAKEYTFERFTEIEIADFDDSQIASFVTKWFQVKQDPPKIDRFIKKLENDEGIRELATSPLLLTLLCLVFEESGSFPANRSELYKEGLDVLLKKWDATRNIERDQIYKKLSLKRKEDMLSQIALTTFEQGNYFFKKAELERYITQYIYNLPDVNPDEAALQLDSEAVLRSIEAQHGLFVERARGIYSFSHLTFHEYFTARKIVSSSNADTLLCDLVAQITEKRWQEVFLLTVGMLESADQLLKLMKGAIDRLLAKDTVLQNLLSWVDAKSRSIDLPYQPVELRAFYFEFAIDRGFDLPLSQTLGFTIGHDLSFNRALDLDLIDTLNSAAQFTLNCTFENASRFRNNFDLSLSRKIDQNLQQVLTALKAELPEISQSNWHNTQQWWQEHGSSWTEKLRNNLMKYRHIGYDQQFNSDQEELLQRYSDANQLLVDCLNSDCYVSRNVREKIKAELLLPISRLGA